MPFTTAELISLGSLTISTLSVSFAAWSLRNSTKALRIAQAEHGEKRKNVESYLMEAKKLSSSTGQSYVAFQLSYINHASVANTIVRAELAVFYADGRGGERETRFQVERKSPKGHETEKCFTLPLNLSPRSAINGWFYFQLAEQMTGKIIKRYEVIGDSSDGAKASVIAYILL